MCGIFGFVGIEDGDALLTMSKSILHRGPDAMGTWSSSELKVHLGQNRLSIIDLSDSAKQPIFNEDKSIILVFNGEIYNYIQLRNDLIVKGHEFKSESDSEVLVHLYEERGTEMVNDIRGMFTFAIFDTKSEKLFIARDHFGIKPLYCYHENSFFAFSSELKALLEHPKVHLEIDHESILNHLCFLWNPFPKTMASNCFKLEPGFAMLFEKNELVKKWQYYDIPFNGTRSGLKAEEAIEELDRLLESSIEEQLVSDVPLGLFLSGGIDSSLIAAYYRKLRPDQKIVAFTIDIQGADMEGNPNDLPYARRVAKDLNIDLEEIIVTPEQVLEYIEELTYILDEPLADPAAINVLLITEIARKKGFKVLLSGAGGDDIFSGYRRHLALQIDQKLNKIPEGIKKIAAKFGKTLPVGNSKLRKARKFLEGADLPLKERIFNYYFWMNEPQARSILTEEIKAELKDYHPTQRLEKAFNQIPSELEPLNQMLYLESKFFLVDHNLNYTDKMSMFASVETRVPFLDQRIVDFAAKLPIEYKIKDGQAKWILKKVAEKYLDHEIIYRKKTGFGAPLRDWVKTDLQDLLDKYLCNEKLDEHGVFNFTEVQKLITANNSGKVDAAYSIFSILCITIWLERFLK